ncbi:MAG: helix-turn-helix transcriptional regulator [Rhizobiaceae bacterium]
MERYLHGDRDHEIADHMRKSFAPIGGDNPNKNWLEAFQSASGTVLTRGETTGKILKNEVHSAPSHIGLCMINSGGAELRTVHGSRTLVRGDIYIMAAKSDFQSLWGPGDMTRIKVPLRPNEDLGGTYDGLYFISHADPVADILQTTLHNLETALREGDSQCADLIMRVADEIVHGFLATERSREERDGYELIRSRVRCFVDKNLDRADLSIDDIADHVHVSRTTLYRAFEKAGGVRRFINRIKLDKAGTMLAHKDTQRGQLIDIAYACGFSSADTFGRAFRKQMGVSPRAYADRSAMALKSEL